MSARRINVGVESPCPHCGYRVRHELLGDDQPHQRPDRLSRYMRIPLEDRLARRADVAA